jgi:hypothetical protein
MNDAFVYRLRRVAEALRSGLPVSPGDAVPLADAFEAYLAGVVPLDEALGLANTSSTWFKSVQQRSSLIAQLAAYYRGTPTRAAKDMAFAAGQYAARTWPRYQHLDELPPFHAGKPLEVFFHLHRNSLHGGARWPLGWTSIYAISKHAIAIENQSAASNNPENHDEDFS